MTSITPKIFILERTTHGREGGREGGSAWGRGGWGGEGRGGGGVRRKGVSAHEGRPAVASAILVGLAELMIPDPSEATFRWKRPCHWWWRSSSRRRRYQLQRRRCCLRRRRGGRWRRRHLQPWVVRRRRWGRGPCRPRQRRGRWPCRPRQRREPARAPRLKSWSPCLWC